MPAASSMLSFNSVPPCRPVSRPHTSPKHTSAKTQKNTQSAKPQQPHPTRTSGMPAASSTLSFSSVPPCRPVSRLVLRLWKPGRGCLVLPRDTTAVCWGVVVWVLGGECCWGVARRCGGVGGWGGMWRTRQGKRGVQGECGVRTNLQTEPAGTDVCGLMVCLGLATTRGCGFSQTRQPGGISRRPVAVARLMHFFNNFGVELLVKRALHYGWRDWCYTSNKPPHRSCVEEKTLKP